MEADVAFATHAIGLLQYASAVATMLLPILAGWLIRRRIGLNR